MCILFFSFISRRDFNSYSIGWKETLVALKNQKYKDTPDSTQQFMNMHVEIKVPVVSAFPHFYSTASLSILIHSEDCTALYTTRKRDNCSYFSL